jgi:hypothetical protein
LQLERPMGDRPEPAGRLLLIPVGIYIEAVRLDLEPSRYRHPGGLDRISAGLSGRGPDPMAAEQPKTDLPGWTEVSARVGDAAPTPCGRYGIKPSRRGGSGCIRRMPRRSACNSRARLG